MSMELLQHLSLGIQVALTPENFLFCLLGATLGTVVGVLPGLGPTTTIAMLLPLTFKIPATSALIMLSGIYYGAHHAGSTTSIMLNMPGEPTSIVICLDGYPMARQGRAGVALCIAALVSFFAGCVCTVAIALFSPPLARVALLFGPPEYTTMILMALVTIVVLSSTSLVLTLGTAVLGLLLGTVGTDLNTGIIRFSFGSNGLVDGVSFVSLAVGVFAFAEVMAHIAAETHRPAERPKISSLIPTRQDLARSWGAALRGTAIGGVLGLMPGTGPLISSFASYVVEKQIAKDPTRFGNGAVEGVAGPEAANNAAALTHFIPMLTLGIPAGSAMALMLGALIIQGITPGPQVMTEHPDLFWGLVVSMWLGNTMLLVLNLPLVGVWVRLLAIPYRLLYPGILMFCCIGVYSLNNSTFDVFLATGFGVLGFGLKKLGCAPAPLLLGLILGPLLEENFRRALLLSRGELTVFIQHPISLGFLIVTALLPFVFLFTSRQALARRSHQAG